MKNLTYQEVSIQEVINEMVRKAIEGDVYTSSGRTIGNIPGHHGPLTVSIVITQDEDAFNYDETLPFVDQEKFAEGKCVVRAPTGLYQSGTSLDAESLDFPEDLYN